MRSAAHKQHTRNLPAQSTARKKILLLLTAILLLAPLPAHAQWDMEESHTTASLRGIYNVGGGVAWASGSNGTVRRTEDGGYLWQVCTTPPGAEKLDFRGIQAWDENTGIVMSSGKGDLSRLYKTTDGCQTWHLLFTNPDKEGFWDALLFKDKHLGLILGDPVDHHFVFLVTENGGLSWQPVSLTEGLSESSEGGGAFAASNSSLVFPMNVFFGASRGWFYQNNPPQGTVPSHLLDHFRFSKKQIPLAADNDSSGIFSLAADHTALLAVGGDYKQPDRTTGTAAFSLDSGKNWQSAKTPPYGYRSAVAWDPTQKFWITVGPNGTDISTDDGKNWRPLKPYDYDTPGTDKDWNALSLPFVVGPHGRIGRLRTLPPEALK
jgi:photosystem II stability/assembly factor-like uncharacterized protein